MKYLITGGCGFIGTSLIAALSSEQDHIIRVVDNLATGTLSDLAAVCRFQEKSPTSLQPMAAPANRGLVELVVGDIQDEKLAIAAAQGANVIVHLAANTGVPRSVQDPLSDCYSNVIGTLNYLEAARRNSVTRFVFASSGAPAGVCEPPIHEEICPHPVSPYGAAKSSGEAYCSAYYHSFDVQTVALRFGNVYGPGSGHKQSIVAKFIRQSLDGNALEIYGDGSQTRDFIYIDDIINAIRFSVDRPDIGGQLFQIATNRETTALELTYLLLDVLEKKGVPRVEMIHTAERTGDVKRNYSDTSKARRMLGWKFATPLRRGLELTVDYFLRPSNEK